MKALRLLSSAMVLLGLSVGVAPAPAAAAPGCTADGCNGKMAAAMNCRTDAFPIAGVQLPETGVKFQPRGDLWYSPTCLAMWADFTVGDENSALVFVTLRTQPEYGGVNKVPQGREIRQPENYVSPMVSWVQSVKLCASHKGTDPDLNPDGFNRCTKWH